MSRLKAGLRPLALTTLLSATALHGASAAPERAAPPPVTGLAAGYLKAEQRPDSVLLVPAAPLPASTAQARDEAMSKRALALKDGPRWDIATRDADLRLPKGAEAFSCALGVQLSSVEAPRLMRLLARSTGDLGRASDGAKTKYMRPRPFMVNGAPICTPDHAPHLRHNGSYPSGHSAIGWGWGLILAELAPDRADAVLSRARAFGQSRVVCNVHWLSDVEEGRVVASETVAMLHANPEFQSDLAAARLELDALRRTTAPGNADCAADAAALADG
ncbi:phosphatase PAP2 family protein [Phenylobacterium sp. LjRoot219]|uniref:acid phosphatase n=1 Tax=Phenylobacterium sp. LjRoot219 TaxID=3342283 RepID=UPI003ECF326A